MTELHTNILKHHIFRDFYEFYPERFSSITNGITQRRWLKLCNPRLAQLITEHIGEGWITDLYELKKLVPLAEDRSFQKEWQKIKRENKEDLAEYVAQYNQNHVDVNSMFDVQVKRIHEYKRQLLNVLHIITLYNRIRAHPDGDFMPRTILFGGKAAPEYRMAKLIIKLISSVADAVNRDPLIGDRLKVVFLANYRVSLAQKIIPAAELSEQISTAGTEASGTGNMKLALNGALTIGTLDGANIEIRDEVGNENIFIFGLTADEILTLKSEGYHPLDYYESNPELKPTLDMIGNGYFSPQQPQLFQPIIDALLRYGDHYCLLADFASYIRCQREVDEIYKRQQEWTKRSILNVANMGRFSSDRTVGEYAEKIWKLKPVPVPDA